VILTLDLGTSRVKAALWEGDGLVDVAVVGLRTDTPAPGASEQDPAGWWTAVEEACSALGADVPGRLQAVEAVACTGARQTFGLFEASGVPVGPAILWSDGRTAPAAGDGAGPGGGSVPGRLAWVSAHRPDDLDRCAWILAPRDLVAWRLTGSVATDPTLASLTGCYDPDGRVSDAVAEGLGDRVAGRLPPVVPSDRVTGTTRPDAAARLGLRSGIPVVIGAGDRQCEVLGTGATAARPMVSWGTTANVSLPVDADAAVPGGIVATRSATGGWQWEGGLSAAGSFLAWLGGLCGRSADDLARLAADCPPGARGVTAVPWLGGARAPWWRPAAAAGFVGLSDAHGPADLARAVFESVARDIDRCLDLMVGRYPPGSGRSELVLAGGGATTPVWVAVLTGTTGRPARWRRSGQAASAGAALLGSRALGESWDLDRLDPVVGAAEPDADQVRRYADLADPADRVAAALVDLGSPPAGRPTACRP
jgi:sugar (pentulose or hexulose) kinase